MKKNKVTNSELQETKQNSSMKRISPVIFGMPHMNGYDATRIIRTLPDPEKAYIPILAMIANAFEEDKREAIHCGMNGHLAKPIDVHELMRELANILG